MLQTFTIPLLRGQFFNNLFQSSVFGNGRNRSFDEKKTPNVKKSIFEAEIFYLCSNIVFYIWVRKLKDNLLNLNFVSFGKVGRPIWPWTQNEGWNFWCKEYFKPNMNIFPILNLKVDSNYPKLMSFIWN